MKATISHCRTEFSPPPSIVTVAQKRNSKLKQEHMTGNNALLPGNMPDYNMRNANQK